MKIQILIISFLFFGICSAQPSKMNARDISVSPFIDGTILMPDTSEETPLVIIIAGSGPTDRNGNQQMMENNSLRYLAEGLYEEGIASFRYDKRIIKQMKDRTINEESIRFDEFIKDAIDVIEFFKKGRAFSKIYILGHSQGSLVGMLAAQDLADGYISVAGAGQEIDEVILAQLSKQAPGLVESSRVAFKELREDGVAVSYSPGVSSIFRKSIQPFILSWMVYSPQVEITKLDMPVLIVNGDKDLQTHHSEAELLKTARPDAELHIISNMNHIMKEIKGDDLENQKSYNEYKRPIMPELLEIISSFIKK